MGLRDDIQSSVGAAFNTSLADAVKSFILRREEATDYDPVYGIPVVNPPIDTSSRGVFSGFDKEEIEDEEIKPTDIKLIILQNEITTKPREGDEIIEGANAYKVFRIKKDPADATYILGIRAGYDE